MKLVFLLPILVLTSTAYAQTPQENVEDKSPVVVLNAKWFRDRQTLDKLVQPAVTPMAALTSADKNYERQKRDNALAGDRDPRQDAVDSRASELERIVQESREPTPVQGYTYQVKFHNAGEKIIRSVLWEYQFTEIANSKNVTRRRFVCGGEIKPDRHRELEVFTLAGPSDVVSVKSLSKESGSQFRADVIVNRVEYSDGTFWQRSGWDVNAYKVTMNAMSGGSNKCRSF